MKTLNLLAGTMTILLIGCATYLPIENKYKMENAPSVRRGMDVYKGRHISEVIQRWGQPHKIVEQSSGGEIYTWKFNAAITTFPDGRLRGRKGTIQPIINLYTHQDGIVYHWTSDTGKRVVRPR